MGADKVFLRTALPYLRQTLFSKQHSKLHRALASTLFSMKGKLNRSLMCCLPIKRKNTQGQKYMAKVYIIKPGMQANLQFKHASG